MINNIFDIRNEVAMITGGNSGIGRAITETLAKCGAKVAIVNRDPKSGEMAARELKKNGLEAVSFDADVRDKEKIDYVVNRIIEKYGKIDILVNSAGINLRKKAVEFDLNDWNEIIEVNLTGTFIVCQAVGRYMIQQKKGRVLNVSSIASLKGLNERGPYCASKAGVSQLTKVIALEWAQHGVYVNAIGPGFINTRLIKGLVNDPIFQKMIKNTVPLQRIGEVTDLQGLVLTLCSKACSYITGQTIYIDGGLSI